MGKTVSTFILFALGLLAQTAVAQTDTNYVNVERRDKAPLYDCGIYRDYRDQRACQNLQRGNRFEWSYRGYAVDCDNLRPHQRNDCFDLASAVSNNPQGTLNCRDLYGERQDQCEIVRGSYQRGHFKDRNDRRDDRRGYGTTTIVTQQEVIVSQPQVITQQQVVVTNTCSADAYDNALNAWRIRKEEQRQRGQRTAAVGAGVGLLGLILSGSSDQATSNVGTALAIGGAFAMTYGLIEMADANSFMPHTLPGCSSAYVVETRRTVVERQQCTTTRYTEHGRHTSRSYYEVNCSSKRYVTYDDFGPWHSGVRY